jgi:beta-xylosidase
MEHPIINDYFASRYATPYKYGEPVLVGSGITGSFDQNAVDSPFVFFHNEVYQMLYIGFDGVGYQTALSQSTDLLHWTPKGVILPRDDQNRWDSINISGNWILKETNDLNRLPTLKKVDGKYWMSYHAYPMSGYESGAGSIGLAWCEDEDLMEWHRMEAPILTVTDPDAQEWEKGGLYKSCLIYHDGLFYLFYNAKNNTLTVA